MRKLFITLLILVSTTPVTAKILNVGIFYDAKPFSYLNAEGKPAGIAVDIWQELARKRNWSYRYKPIKTTYDQAITDLAHKKYDVLVGPVSVTHERTKLITYSHPYFLNRIGVVVRQNPTSFWHVIAFVIGKRLLIVLGVFLLIFIIFTHLFWYFDHKHSEKMTSDYKRGIGSAMWIMTTSFLRDILYDPHTTRARIVLATWLFISVVFMALFVAVITSSLTVAVSHQYREQAPLHDLHNEIVAVEGGTTNEDIARKLGAKALLTNSTLKAMELVSQRKASAVIEDYFLALDLVNLHPKLKLKMSNLVIGNDLYAFPLPQGSPLLKSMDLDLTRLQDQGFAEAICKKYISKFTDSCEF